MHQDPLPLHGTTPHGHPSKTRAGHLGGGISLCGEDGLAVSKARHTELKAGPLAPASLTHLLIQTQDGSLREEEHVFLLTKTLLAF